MAARAAQAKAAPTGLAAANPAANLPKAAVDQVTIVLPRPQGLPKEGFHKFPAKVFLRVPPPLLVGWVGVDYEGGSKAGPLWGA